MSDFYAHFQGDPLGYRVPKEAVEKWEGEQYLGRWWTEAFIGTTDDKAKVDLQKAYLIRPAGS